MTKLLMLLLIGLLFEAVGVVYLSKGLKQFENVQKVSVAEIVRVIKSGVTNPNILLGVFFEAVFFGTLLVLMARGGEVSVLWPLTALGFVFTTLAARLLLHEQVSLVRWGGVVLIMLGAALITYSVKKEEQKARPQPAAVSTPPTGN